MPILVCIAKPGVPNITIQTNNGLQTIMFRTSVIEPTPCKRCDNELRHSYRTQGIKFSESRRQELKVVKVRKFNVAITYEMVVRSLEVFFKNS